jgi:hypothetical protein
MANIFNRAKRLLDASLFAPIPALLWILICLAVFVITDSDIDMFWYSIKYKWIAIVTLMVWGALLDRTIRACFREGWHRRIVTLPKHAVQKALRWIKLKRELRAFLRSERERSNALVVGQSPKTPPVP